MSVTALFPFSQAFSFLFPALPRVYVSQAFVPTKTLVKVAVTSMVPNPVVSCTAIIIMVSSSSLFSPLSSFPASLSRKNTASPSASRLFQHYSISFCFLTAELFILSSVTFLIFEKSLLSLNSSSQFLCFAAALEKNSSAFLSACTSLSSSSWNLL